MQYFLLDVRSISVYKTIIFNCNILFMLQIENSRTLREVCFYSPHTPMQLIRAGVFNPRPGKDISHRMRYEY